MKKILGGILMAALVATSAEAALRTEKVEYRHGDAVLAGYLAYDDSMTGKRPGVLVVHEWWGLNDYAKRRAEQLAALGYVAFALDMYGKGQATGDPKEAGRLSGMFKDNRPLGRARAAAGLDVLRSRPQVDPARIAAIGYCFGGMVALEMARAGFPLSGVVSFHGNLKSASPEDARLAVRPHASLHRRAVTTGLPTTLTLDAGPEERDRRTVVAS